MFPRLPYTKEVYNVVTTRCNLIQIIIRKIIKGRSFVSLLADFIEYYPRIQLKKYRKPRQLWKIMLTRQS
jgi:hypothetical protein